MSTREDYRLHYENQDPLEDGTTNKQNNLPLIKQSKLSKAGREPLNGRDKQPKIPDGD